MSQHENDTPNARAIDALVSEAREHLDTKDVDWSRLEARLMESIELEKPALLRDVEQAGTTRARVVRGVAVVLAAAAAVLLFARRDPVGTSVVGASRPVSNEGVPASSLRSTEGSGEIRVGGVVATPGYVVRAGDTIEADHARGVLERPRKVSWLIEQDGPDAARAVVKSAGESLVLGLDHGAIEAQVVPVPAGEAFAVDIATERTLVRVAVHGTHLRVVRNGSHVVVDLTEGVVAIGVPPRTGVTYGTTVTAPAHVELDATDLTTLRVDHSLGSVRAAIPLGAAAEAARHEPVLAPAVPMTAVPPVVAPPAHAALAPLVPASPTKVDVPKAPLPPREAVAAAVRDCAAARSRSGEVHVSVSSSLRLTVSPTGAVEAAQFTPPLLPDIQSCAAQTIYKLKLDETGAVTIPIEFDY